jgi:hypothetical protein
MIAGTPKQEIQVVRRAAQLTAVVEESGTTSGHLGVRPMMVKK